MNLNREVSFETKEEASLFYSNLKEQYTIVAGLDEAGCGPLAGPVVVGCVVLPSDHGIVGIQDSKKLTPKRREELADQIIDKAITYGIGTSDNNVINDLGLTEAKILAGLSAINQLSIAPDLLLCDGNLNFSRRISFPYISVIDGDDYYEEVSAASILAKVWHDQIMAVYHEIYPMYNWNKNQGYGTAAHIEAIKKYGITSFHRKSFGICKTAFIREE